MENKGDWSDAEASDDRRAWDVIVGAAAAWGDGTLFTTEDLVGRLIEAGMFEYAIHRADGAAPSKALAGVLQHRKGMVSSGWTIEHAIGSRRPRRWVVRTVRRGV